MSLFSGRFKNQDARADFEQARSQPSIGLAVLDAQLRVIWTNDAFDRSGLAGRSKALTENSDLRQTLLDVFASGKARETILSHDRELWRVKVSSCDLAVPRQVLLSVEVLSAFLQFRCEDGFITAHNAAARQSLKEPLTREVFEQPAFKSVDWAQVLLSQLSDSHQPFVNAPPLGHSSQKTLRIGLMAAQQLCL